MSNQKNGWLIPVTMIAVVIVPPLVTLIVELIHRNPSNGGLLGLIAVATCVAIYRVNRRAKRPAENPDAT